MSIIKQNKLMLYSMLLLLLLLLGSIFYFHRAIIDTLRFWNKPRIEKQFIKSLIRFVKSGEKSIALLELTNFDWEKACWFGPYQIGPPIKVQANDCLTWKGDENCLLTEGQWGMQFVDNKGNITTMCIERRIVDVPIIPTGCVLKNGAIAKIVKIPDSKHRSAALALQIEGRPCEN